MSKQNSWKRLLIGGAAATAVVAGIAAFTLAPASVSAQDAPADAPTAEDGGRWFGNRHSDDRHSDDRRPDGRGHGGPAGMMEHGFKGGDQGEYLAAELAKLGISAEAFDAAQEEVRAETLAQMAADGVITQEQADQMAAGEGRFGGRGGHIKGGFGPGNDAVDHDALLAEKLDISVEELQAAKDAARQASLENAIEQGDVTQEQADQMRAMDALRDSIDHEAILANVLGVSVEELQTAHEAGTVRELFETSGLDREAVQEAMQAGFDEAVSQAVADGVITQEQADAIENGEGFGGRGFPGRGGHPGGHGGRGMGPDGFERGNDDGESSAPRFQRQQSGA